MELLKATLTVFSVIFLTGIERANADAVADFYRGKQITIAISSGVGGGYDLYGRFLARFLGKHIPGNPTVIVKNVPGAGGIVAANRLYALAADGLTIGALHGTNTLSQLAGSGGVKFDVRKFEWIGSMNTGATICALSGKAKDLTAKELFKTEITIGADAGAASMIPLLLNNLAGSHFKVVQGYPNTSAVKLAMERGEVNGMCGWAWDGARVNAKEMLAQGKARVSLDIAIEPEPELKADGAPFLMDLLPDGENKDMLKIILSTQVYGRPFALPPGVPSDRVRALREAFVVTLKDPEFQAAAAKIGLEVEYLSPKRIDELIGSVFDAPPGLQRRAVEELQKAGFSDR